MFLESLPREGKVLLLGDGDGRFAEAVLKQSPNSVIDYVDASAKMIEIARQRLGSRAERVRFIHRDVRGFRSDTSYDVVITHFLLDCFDSEDCRSIVGTTAARLHEGGHWIVSEFAIPDRGWRHWRARFCIRALYLAFGALTGLEARRIPEYRRIMREMGLSQLDSATLDGGLLEASHWRKT